MICNAVRKLNLGCGSRFCDDPTWENLDYPGKPPTVRRVNLIHGLPYTSNTFDFIYTSHVLDHFVLVKAEFLVKEALRVLKPGGVLRVSVPDLEYNCRRYLTSLEANRSDPEHHRWHVIELLDQMVRTERGGEKAKFLSQSRERPEIQEWLLPLLGYEMRQFAAGPEPMAASGLRWLKSLAAKLIWSRSFDKSGERHFWTYDRITLFDLFRRSGFVDVTQQDFTHSLYRPYELENLDIQDGQEYKPGSLYVEGLKP